ncbi:MAG: hypothetical protein J5879_07305 [Clostridia bacterium]|nr:hypothetical protein [Clostridia bacterium]
MADKNAVCVDFHSHILPAMDDGSPDLTVSAGQLTRLKKQGAERVFLTSHFDFRKEKREKFIARRAESYERLMEIYDPQTMPEVSLGSEIYMARGIDGCDYSGLELEGTGTVMIEFPREQFGVWMFDLLETLMFERKMKVMIAHVNRVTAAYKKDVCNNLFDYQDLIFQVNCEAFHGLFTSDPFKGYDVSGLKFVLGTDTHDLSRRAPDFDRALKKLNGGALSYMYQSIGLTEALLCKRHKTKS